MNPSPVMKYESAPFEMDSGEDILGSNVLPDVNLDTVYNCFLSFPEKLFRGPLIHIFLSAILTDLCRNSP
jgi:hypothetical protein